MPELHFSKAELALLAKAVYVADWVANSHAEDESAERLDLDEVRRKIYRALNEGEVLEPWEEDAVTGEIFEPKEWEEETLAALVDPFVEDAVGERVIARLADQYFEEWFGKDAFADQPDRRADLLYDIEDAIGDGIDQGGKVDLVYRGPLPSKEEFLGE